MKGVFVVTEISEGRIMVSPYQENIFSSGKSVLSRIEVMNPKHFNVERVQKFPLDFQKDWRTFREYALLCSRYCAVRWEYFYIQRLFLCSVWNIRKLQGLFLGRLCFCARLQL